MFQDKQYSLWAVFNHHNEGMLFINLGQVAAYWKACNLFSAAVIQYLFIATKIFKEPIQALIASLMQLIYFCPLLQNLNIIYRHRTLEPLPTGMYWLA